MTNIASTNIGVSIDGKVTICLNDGGNAVMSLLDPGTARVFASMMMALADQIDAAALTPKEAP